jgi:DNA-binding LytR/AlgR family response regulator
MLNCLIIEDEKPASDLIKDYVGTIPGLKLIAVCEDVMSATQILSEQQVDIIFLDINLPKINGIDFIKTIHKKYHVIITTAYDNYAIQGFELDVTDYLLKPISFERFLKAVNKVMSLIKGEAQVSQNEVGSDYFFVKSDNKYEKIAMQEILYVEALQNYIIIHCTDKKVITYSSLKGIESYLSAKEFLRVQKSFIVSVAKIDRIDGDDVVIGKTLIPISRSLKEDVMNSIVNNRLFKHKN